MERKIASSGGWLLTIEGDEIVNVQAEDAGFAEDVRDLTWDTSEIRNHYDSITGQEGEILLAVVTYTHNGQRHTDHAPAEPVRCPTCDGDGYIMRGWRHVEQCPNCYGRRFWEWEDADQDWIRATLQRVDRVLSGVDQ